MLLVLKFKATSKIVNSAMNLVKGIKSVLAKQIQSFERSAVSAYFTWKAIKASPMLFSSLDTINI